MGRIAFRIARIAGIDINIDWSWVLIFLLLTWQLGGALFPYLHRTWGPGLVWGLAVATSLLFFASVLAHELAHSLVSKALGLPVRSITLFLFGGVSNIQHEPPSAGKEFLIAIVGPVTSFIIAAICLLLGGTVAAGTHFVGSGGVMTPARLGPGGTMLFWLGSINAILGVFNLVPGFPLDGGRVLRSILWGVTGNLRAATRWASFVGQVIAWAMIAAGVAMFFGLRLPFLGGGAFSGLWLAFIGWFLNNAAIASYRQLVVQNTLEGVPVTRLMRTDIPTVPPDMPLSRLVYERFMQDEENCYPVQEGERLVGLICAADIRAVPREEWEWVPVSRVMTPVDRLEVVRPGDDLTGAVQRLSERGVEQAPVMEGDRFLGVIRLRDIVRWLQTQADDTRGAGPGQRRAA